MSRYVDLNNPKIRHMGRDKFGDGIYHIPPDLPTANVVEVVRCKDCKHRPYKDEDGDVFAPSWDDETCPCICEDCYYNWMPEDDFFCGKGERREDATD